MKLGVEYTVSVRQRQSHGHGQICLAIEFSGDAGRQIRQSIVAACCSKRQRHSVQVCLNRIGALKCLIQVQFQDAASPVREDAAESASALKIQ